jgi:hypothetical protein
MSSFSDYLENKVLAHVFGGTAYTAPSTLYLALYTVAPTDTGGGTEVSGGSYVRLACAFTVTGNLATNTAAEEWPVATGTWGTVVAVGVFDALTSGNLLAYGNLTASKTITSGDVFRIPIGDLDITLT